jgi:hypothetical protein
MAQPSSIKSLICLLVLLVSFLEARFIPVQRDVERRTVGGGVNLTVLPLGEYVPTVPKTSDTQFKLSKRTARLHGESGVLTRMAIVLLYENYSLGQTIISILLEVLEAGTYPTTNTKVIEARK